MTKNKVKNTIEDSVKKEKIGSIKAVGKKKSIFLSILNGTFLTKENVIKNLPIIFYICFLMIGYIAYGYYAELTIKSISKADAEIKELKAESLSSQSELEHLKQQSTVAQNIKALGLAESTNPPQKILATEAKE
jgi:Bacteriodetes cell division protein (FtsL-like)